MPMLPRGFVSQTQIASAVRKAIRKLGKRALTVNYTVGEDASGDPAIYFRVVLSDADSQRDKLSEVTQKIEQILSEELQPYENWGLIPYVNFRSRSEQIEFNDPKWN